ncbi:MAG: EF-hand domain-containing protein [Planctomycetaceae bacterium]|nr:EF-hand domain-containing protein [Planctomycetaceae bacterium]
MKRTILTAITAAVMSAMSLVAQEDDLFARLDANKDGVVTADEVQGDAKGLFERALRRGDKDGDKKLTKDEFAAAQKESDAPRRPLAQGGGPGRPGGGQFNPRELFARLDENKDGKLSESEAKGQIKENFLRLDVNADGFVTEEEIERAGGRRPDAAPGAPGAGNRPDPEQLAAMFDRLDANKDGKLTKDEVPEGQRERFAQALERLGADSMGKDQFPRFMAMMAQFGRPDEGRPGEGRPGQPGPGGGRPPLVTALDADSDGELSASEIESASKALLKLDKNSDGKLTREELFPGAPDGPPRGRPGERRPGDRPGEARPDARRPAEGRPAEGRRGFNPEELQARLKEADKNGDGQLSKDEAPPMLKERFDRIDANGDGQLDQTELKQMIERLREGGGDRPQRRPEGRRPGGDRPDAPRRE